MNPPASTNPINERADSVISVIAEEQDQHDEHDERPLEEPKNESFTDVLEEIIHVHAAATPVSENGAVEAHS